MPLRGVRKSWTLHYMLAVRLPNLISIDQLHSRLFKGVPSLDDPEKPNDGKAKLRATQVTQKKGRINWKDLIPTQQHCLHQEQQFCTSCQETLVKGILKVCKP